MCGWVQRIVLGDLKNVGFMIKLPSGFEIFLNVV
jgi:hypothetical protein